MESLADVDVDIVCHLGHIQNVDLIVRGVYILQVTLFCGDEKIPPIGLFSAPSTLDSKVRSQRIPPPPLLNPCHVDDDNGCFRCRSFVVRYRDEIHELNDGVHWRLTVPKVCVNSAFSQSNSSTPISLDHHLLRVQFELLCAPLIQNPSLDYLMDIEQLIPEEPSFAVVACQDLHLQRVASGVHMYAPVRFDKTHGVNLDCMFHCGITAVRYTDIIIESLATMTMRKKHRDSMEAEGLVNKTPGQQRHGSIYVDEEEHSHWYCEHSDDNSSRSSGLERRLFDAGDTSHEESQDGGSVAVQFGGAVIDEQFFAVQLHADTASADVSDLGSFVNNPSLMLDGRGTHTPEIVEEEVVSTSTLPYKSPRPKPSGRPFRKGTTPLPNRNVNRDQLNSSPDMTASHLSIDPHSPPSEDLHTLSFTPSKLKQRPTTTVKGSVGMSPMPRKPQSPFISRSHRKVHTPSAVPTTCDTPSTSTPQSPRPIAVCGLGIQQIESLVDKYCFPILVNYDHLMSSLDKVVSYHTGSVTPVGLDEDPHYAKLVVTSSATPSCVLYNRKELISLLMKVEYLSDLKSVLLELLNQCNNQSATRWLIILKTLPRILTAIRKDLWKSYLYQIRIFWKRQLLVVHFSSESSSLMRSDQEYLAQYAQILHQLVESERQLLQINLIPQVSERESEDNFQLFEQSDCCYARGLFIYDPMVHMDINKLPILVVEQYEAPDAPVSPQWIIQDIWGGNAFRSGPNTLLGCVGDVVDCGAVVNADMASMKRVILPHLMRHSAAMKYFNNALPDPKRGPPMVSNSTVESVVSNDDDVPFTRMRAVSLVGQTQVIPPSLCRVGYHTGEEQNVDLSPNENTANVVVGDVHIVVLQHGYAGNSYDMCLLKNVLTSHFPDYIHVLCARSNEKNSGEPLAVMGKRLATEIVAFCVDKFEGMLRNKGPGRISFIGHSAGGLIIRKCLEEPCMAPLLSRLHSYISLASPHLGTLYADSQVVSTGMWALLKLNKTPLLKELMLEDRVKISTIFSSSTDGVLDSALYKLSKNGVLQYFRRVILVASSQDQYVPVYSARVQISPKAELNAKLGPSIVSMSANMLSQVEPERLVRISVENNTHGNDHSADTAQTTHSTTASQKVDLFIGRTAHICYLDNPVVVDALMLSLYSYLI